MKILQLNIWGGKLGANIIQLLQKEQPDVVCFQEATRFEEGSSFFFLDVDYIAKVAEYPYVHFSPHIGYSYMKRDAQMGLAILSKFPFETTAITPIRLSFTENFDLLDTDYNVQTLQHVIVRKDNLQYHVLNYHGFHIDDHKLGTEENIRQCEIIMSTVETLEGNVIICGDFNVAPESESIKILERNLKNLITESTVTTTRTCLSKKVEICDYIFVSGNISHRSFTVLEDLASDHKALTVVI
jgi:endonuclease/exonuclease/phosphatase family metal-dependent hydrolase